MFVWKNSTARITFTTNNKWISLLQLLNFSARDHWMTRFIPYPLNCLSEADLCAFQQITAIVLLERLSFCCDMMLNDPSYVQYLSLWPRNKRPWLDYDCNSRHTTHAWLSMHKSLIKTCSNGGMPNIYSVSILASFIFCSLHLLVLVKIPLAQKHTNTNPHRHTRVHRKVEQALDPPLRGRGNNVNNCVDKWDQYNLLLLSKITSTQI